MPNTLVLFTGYLIRQYRLRTSVEYTFIPAALLVGVWFLIQLFHAGEVAPVQTGGVAYLAHVGGFVFGATTARWFERWGVALPDAD